MKFLLVYYTGTYNTRFLTDELQASLTAHGHEVDRVEIDCKTQPVSTEGYDMIGFSYPIYGFNAPKAFTRYTKKLQYQKGQKFFIYKNSGETLAMNNASSRKLLRLMRRRKCTFAGEYHFILPYNIHFRFEYDCVREILHKNEKLLRILVDDLEKGRVRTIKSKWIYNFAAFFVNLVNVCGNVNSFFYRVDMNKCIKCMKCVKDCPEQNIRFEKGKIKLGHNCDACMRCSFFCPTDAFKIGFLEGWHVNGDYRLKEVKKDCSPLKPFVTADTKGFFESHYRSFQKIDEEYQKLFGDE